MKTLQSSPMIHSSFQLKLTQVQSLHRYKSNSCLQIGKMPIAWFDFSVNYVECAQTIAYHIQRVNRQKNWKNNLNMNTNAEQLSAFRLPNSESATSCQVNLNVLWMYSLFTHPPFFPLLPRIAKITSIEFALGQTIFFSSIGKESIVVVFIILPSKQFRIQAITLPAKFIRTASAPLHNGI